jgi:hypothetical protein
MKNIIIGLVSVVVIASVIYFAPSFKKTSPEIADIKKTSIESLLTMGGTKKCVYSAEVNGVTTSATIYLHDGNMRADSKITLQGKEIDSHIIFLKDTSYVWGAGMPQGFKMDVKKLKEQNVAKTSQEQSFDMKKEVNYSCSSWSYDETFFTLPSSISFTDVSMMMQQKMGASPSVGGGMNAAGSLSSACDACNSVPESAKAQCKAALHCK